MTRETSLVGRRVSEASSVRSSWSTLKRDDPLRTRETPTSGGLYRKLVSLVVGRDKGKKKNRKVEVRSLSRRTPFRDPEYIVN